MTILKDGSKMPWGKYKGLRMIDIPAAYLLWLYDNSKNDKIVREYIEDNLDVLKSQIK